MNLAPVISKRKMPEESFFESLKNVPIFRYERDDSEQIVVIPSRRNGKSLYQMRMLEAIMDGRVTMPLPRSRYK